MVSEASKNGGNDDKRIIKLLRSLNSKELEIRWDPLYMRYFQRMQMEGLRVTKSFNNNFIFELFMQEGTKSTDNLFKFE